MTEKNIPQATIDAANSDIVGVISKFIKLTKDGGEYSACCPFHNEKTPSFKVNPKKGIFYCFGCGESGDAVQFVVRHTGASFPDAVERIMGNLPDNPIETRRRVVDEKPVWESLPVVPDGAGDPPQRHYKHGKPSAHWEYLNAEGQLIGYVCRFEIKNEDGNQGKETIPICFARNTTTGDQQWRWLSFGVPRPLFGLEQLASKPNAKVLIVEGEKTAIAARDLFPTFAVISWPGGGKAVSKADWKLLAGRDVIYWPDWDWKKFKAPHSQAGQIMPMHMQPGVTAMRDIHKIISGIVQSARVVPQVDGCPDGWDLADQPWRDDFEPIAYAKQHITDASEWFGMIVRQATAPEQKPKPDAATPIGQAIKPSDTPMDVGTVDIYTPLFDSNSKGNPISTIENMREILRRLSVDVRYNVIKKQMEILIPGAQFSLDNYANASMAHIISWTHRFGMTTGNVAEYLLALADTNPYNPVANWIFSKEWDGKSRTQELFDTVKESEVKRLPDGRSLKEAMMMRWLISAVAAIFEPNGISAHGVLVLQGGQYAGKTKWMKMLAPKELGVVKDGVTLNPSDKDSVMLCVSNWIVELGELDATFRKSDIASLKSFLTMDSDKLRLPYARAVSEFARRTVFFASVNPRQFLHDPTGNRRFWTVECASVDYNHTVDMQQLWAEIYHYYRQGVTWYLDQDEFRALNSHNEDYTSSDPVHDMIDSGYDWGIPRENWRWRMTATDICMTAGIQKPSKHEINSASGYVTEKYKVKTIKTSGTKYWLMPDKMPKYSLPPHDPANPYDE